MEPNDAGVIVTEADQLGIRYSRQGGKETIVANEGLVAVLRDGDPACDRLVVEACPSPLSTVSVPIADEEVEQPCVQKRASVHPVAWTAQDSFEDFVPVDDLGCTGEGLQTGACDRPGFDEAQRSREALPVEGANAETAGAL